MVLVTPRPVIVRARRKVAVGRLTVTFVFSDFTPPAYAMVDAGQGDYPSAS